MKITTTKWQDSPVNVTRPVFAIGDVHGQLHLLNALHEKLFARLESKYDNALLVHVGDYIDRGENSFAVLHKVIGMQQGDAPANLQVINLPGNHEWMLVHFVANPTDMNFLSMWLRNGGTDTLRPYIKLKERMSPDELTTEALNAINKQVGKILPTILDWPCAFREGQLLFVHAGVPPSMSLEQVINKKWFGLKLDTYHPLWIREPFLSNDTPWLDGTIVVHGHTMREAPEICKTRINVDTGAFDSGILTMIEFNKNRLRFHSTESPN